MKYVILSSDGNPDYYSLLPLVCHSWRKFGYKPVILLVNVPFRIQQIINQFCGHPAMVSYPAIDGIKDSTYAQLSRLFAWQTQPFTDEDILVSGDADMVIGKDIFVQEVSDGQIISYGYDLTGKSELPICYIKSSVAKWRDLMGSLVTPTNAYSEDWNLYWSVDQQLLTQRAHEYGIGRITFVDRGNQNKHGLPTGRWDRHDWAHIPDDIIDVHMLRNSWDAQIQVFQRLWPGEDYSFILKFKDEIARIS